MTTVDSDDEVVVQGKDTMHAGLVSINHGVQPSSTQHKVSMAKAVEPVPDSICPSSPTMEDIFGEEFEEKAPHRMLSNPKLGLKRKNAFWDDVPQSWQRQACQSPVAKPVPFDDEETVVLGEQDVATDQDMENLEKMLAWGRKDSDSEESKMVKDGPKKSEMVKDGKMESVPKNSKVAEKKDMDSNAGNVKSKGGKMDLEDGKVALKDAEELLKDPRFAKGTKMKGLSPSSQDKLKEVRRLRAIQNSNAWHSSFVSKGVRKDAEGESDSKPAAADGSKAEPSASSSSDPLTLKDAKALCQH